MFSKQKIEIIDEDEDDGDVGDDGDDGGGMVASNMEQMQNLLEFKVKKQTHEKNKMTCTSTPCVGQVPSIK